MALFDRGRKRRFSGPRRANTNALTAAGMRVRRENADALRRVIQPWQARAFAYYDICGEAKYAAQFYSRMLSPLRLYPAEIDEAGDIVETSKPEVVKALARIQDPGGGRAGLLGSYGRLMFIAGEAQLFVTRNPETEIEQWEMLSTDELRIQDGTYIRYTAPSLNPGDYKAVPDGEWEPVEDDTAVAYRLWKRHPRYSMLADSTMQGVLDLFEELVLLTQAVRARARSRLAGSGILFIDDRISEAPPEPVGDEDPEVDLFLAELTEAMTQPITDEGAASSVVPLVVRVPMPPDSKEKVSDMVYHLQIVDPTQLYPETGLRRECIERIAIGLDMPPEILLGLTDSNHWTSWQIDEQTWKGHGQPIAQQFCDDVTAAYLRPMLKQQGLADWQKYSIAYDASAIINHPDRSKDAKDLHDRIVLSDLALREATGFDEEDAPAEDERNKRIGIQLKDVDLAVTGEIKEEPEPEPVPPGLAVPGEDETAPNTGAEVDKGPPKGTPPGVDEALDASGMTVHRILGAADLALLRAREVAGNRARSLARRDPSVNGDLSGVRPGQICATLGKDRLKALRAPGERELVSGAHDLILDTLRVFGLKADVAGLIAETIEQHAARTLYDEKPVSLPPSFKNYVAGLTKKAG